MGIGLPPGSMKVFKVDDNDNWIEETLTEQDFPAMVTTTGTQTISGIKTFAEDVNVSGTLTSQQGIIYIQDEDIYLDVQDRFLTLNNELTGSPIEDCGIEINRGSSTNSRLYWDENLNVWKAGISGNEGAVLTSGRWGIDTYGAFVFSGGINGTIRADTQNGSDTGSLHLGGGGSTQSSRGGYVSVYGNDNPSNPGHARLVAGTSGGGVSLYCMSVGTGTINFYTNGETTTPKWLIDHNGYLKTNESFGVIGCNTSDGSDTDILQLMAGGADNNNPHTRGGYIRLHGNEHDNAGYMQAFAGNAGGKCQVGTRGNGILEFWVNNSSKWYLDESGNLSPDSDGYRYIGDSTHHVDYIHARVMTSYLEADMYILQRTSNDIIFRTNNSDRWSILAGGDLRPANNNTYDIATNSTRCAYIYSNNFLPFTGVHLYKLKDEQNLTSGDAVKLNSGKLEICSNEKDPTCLGVFTGESIITPSGGAKDSLGNVVPSGTHLYVVAAVGDSVTEDLPGIKVCNEGGNISAGDYLCTASGYEGHLKKQDDDLNHNYTKFLALQDVTFSGSPTESGIYGYFIN